MRDTSDERARLATARFVAEHWRKAMVEWGKPGDAHPLCMVLAALDGATDPVECGIDAEQHHEFRRIVSGSGS